MANIKECYIMTTRELINLMLDKIQDEKILLKIYRYICYWYSKYNNK